MQEARIVDWGMRLARRYAVTLGRSMSPLLLLPLDGSAKDEWALPIAATFAELTSATVLMIRVIDNPAPATRDVEQALTRRVADFATSGQRASFRIAVSDDVAGELLRVADENDAALVVMATRAPGSVDQAIRGSVADQLVRESRRPIVVAPPGADYMRGKLLHLRRVLVPLDGSRAALEVVELLLSWPRAAELEIVLLRVVEPDPKHLKATRARRALDEIADQVRPRCAVVETRVVEANDPSAVIVGAVRQELAEFIAMTTHGAGGLERLVFGSVAQQVVRASEIPLLLMTPADNGAWR
jgi:nucleotide-binding universal stress UspA family protein